MISQEDWEIEYAILRESTYDRNSTASEEYARQLQGVSNRNKQLTRLISNYIEQENNRAKKNATLKQALFWTFVGMLGLLTIGVIIVFLVIVSGIKEKSIDGVDVNSLISLLTVSATYLTSLLAIFKIMSTYLFPLDEEKDTIEMVKTIISNDVKIEEIVNNRLNEHKLSPFDTLRELQSLRKDGIINETDIIEIKTAVLKQLMSQH